MHEALTIRGGRVYEGLSAVDAGVALVIQQWVVGGAAVTHRDQVLAVTVGFGAHRQAAELHAVLIAGRDLQALQLLEGVPCYFIRSQEFTLLRQSVQRVPDPHVKDRNNKHTTAQAILFFSCHKHGYSTISDKNDQK